MAAETKSTGKAGIDVNQILKWAFVFSFAAYVIAAIAVAGPPKWDAAWIPADQTQRIILAVLAFLALGGWVAGWVEGHSEDSPQTDEEEAKANAPKEPHRFRFILAAALIEIGALCGLLAAVTFKDCRYAIAAAVPAAVLLILTPASPGSGPEQGASGESE